MNPNIYYYNPTCELAVANGSENYQAAALLRKFEYDLDIIPAFLGHPNDIVLVQKMPSQQFLDELNRAGIEIPKPRLLNECLNDPSFIGTPKGFLIPWGWSPAVHKLLAPLKPFCSDKFQQSPISRWKPVHKELYSRKQGLELLKSIVSGFKYQWMLPAEELPVICTTHQEIIELQNKWGRVVVKSPWSSSGRGLQILHPKEYNQSNQQVISGFLNQQKYVVVGPWHNKKFDLSCQFFSNGNGTIEYRGLSSFITNKSGKYTGSYLEEIPGNLNQEVKDFIEEHMGTLQQLLSKALTESPYSTEYYGWIGVDSIVYDPEGFGNLRGREQLMIHPCLEVNCRYTMGAISLALRDHLAEGSTGIFQIKYGKEGQFMRFCEEMGENEPLLVRNGKIIKGFIPLTPPLADSLFGAYLNVQSREHRAAKGDGRREEGESRSEAVGNGL